MKGHQDDLQCPLTVLEHLICWMDSKAKQIVRSNLRSRRRICFDPFTLGLGTITIDDSMVYTHIQQSLYHHITHKAFVEPLGETLEVDTDILQASISLSTFGKARKSCPLPLAVFVTKWISNIAATGKVMVARQHRNHSNCPICDDVNEDVLHVLTCQHHILPARNENPFCRSLRYGYNLSRPTLISPHSSSLDFVHGFWIHSVMIHCIILLTRLPLWLLLVSSILDGLLSCAGMLPLPSLNENTSIIVPLTLRNMVHLGGANYPLTRSIWIHHNSVLH